MMVCAFTLATPCCARGSRPTTSHWSCLYKERLFCRDWSSGWCRLGGWVMAMNALGDNEKKGDTTC